MKERRKDCKYCGKELTEGNTNREFCSPKHRVYWNRENKKKKESPTPPPKKEVETPKPPKQEMVKEVAPKETGLTAFQIYQRKKLGLK